MLNFIKIKRIFQGETKRNRIHLNVMKSLGYSMPRIRKTLIECNNINIAELANGKMAPATMYNTVNGLQKSMEAMDLIAGELGLDRQELFPG